jgi:hypothetical protein
MGACMTGIFMVICVFYALIVLLEKAFPVKEK